MEVYATKNLFDACPWLLVDTWYESYSSSPAPAASVGSPVSAVWSDGSVWVKVTTMHGSEYIKKIHEFYSQFVISEDTRDIIDVLQVVRFWFNFSSPKLVCVAWSDLIASVQQWLEWSDHDQWKLESQIFFTCFSVRAICAFKPS